MKIIVLLVCILLVGCSTTTDKILRMRSLSTLTNPSVTSESAGDVMGLKELTANAKNTNVVLIHGIGWTQELSNQKFGDELIRAILLKYNGSQKISEVECLSSTLDGKKISSNKPNGLGIYSSLYKLSNKSLTTDDQKLNLQPYRLGCLDKVVIKIEPEKTITVYRFLWDDAMWNSIEWKQIGYDDPIPPNTSYSGAEDLDKLRAKVNSQLKNSIVTYGFTDAAMYLGLVGDALREGVQGSLCVALSNSFEQLRQGVQVNAAEMCAKQPASKSPLLIISHSLGSRIIFDTLKTDLTTELAKQIELGVSNNTIEVHMLANQLPLIGIGRMGVKHSTDSFPNKDLKLVAYSEINDLLTYELVPYFEQMCYTRTSIDTRCNIEYLADKDLNRKNLSNELGFDVVDVRLSFAPNLINFYSGFKNPKVAHSGYLMSSSVLDVLFCGAKNGKSNSRCNIK